MTMTCSIAVAAQAVPHSQDHSRLVLVALAGIAAIILLIVWKKVHPFLALTLGSAVLALAAPGTAAPVSVPNTDAAAPPTPPTEGPAGNCHHTKRRTPARPVREIVT